MRGRRLSLALLAASSVGLFAPAAAAAHELSGRYEAPLPLIAYVAGAALAVAMSFIFVMLRSPRPTDAAAPIRRRRLPAWLRRTMQGIGLLAWLWIVAQAIGGGSSDADVASLFLWVYGWVGVALISALVGPVWSYLDPFSTLHSLLGWLGRRVGLTSGGTPPAYPSWLGSWPAVIGFVVIVWLELVGRVEGGRTLGVVLVGYTFYALAGMSLFGRDAWRANGEVFSVWFGTLGRLAPYALDGLPEEGRIVRRPMASGLRGGARLEHSTGGGRRRSRDGRLGRPLGAGRT